MTWDSGPWAGDDFAEADWRRLIGQGIGCKLLDIGSLSFSTSNRQVTWSGAMAVVNGGLARMTASEVFDFPVPSGSNRRIDYLVLRYDPSQALIPDKIKAAMKLGAQALNPSAPALTQDPNGIFELPIARIGPWGTGAVGASTTPRLDMRNYRTVVRGAAQRDALFNMGNEMGDIGFTPDNIYRHNGDTWVPYLGNPDSALVYSTPDSGYPRSIPGRNHTPIVTNQLTVPSASYRRALLITAQHYLYVEAGANVFDSVLLLGSSNSPVRRGRHPESPTVDLASSVTLTTVYNLPANQSLRIRVGFIRYNENSDGHNATSSAQSMYNNINVLAAPTYLSQAILL